MVELSISVEGWFGLTWPDWKRLVREVEDLGFAGLNNFMSSDRVGGQCIRECINDALHPSGVATWSGMGWQL